MPGWHIDHIRPCSSFDLSDPKQQEECFHYTNLQPLWKHDNRLKSDKTDSIWLAVHFPQLTFSFGWVWASNPLICLINIWILILSFGLLSKESFKICSNRTLSFCEIRILLYIPKPSFFPLNIKKTTITTSSHYTRQNEGCQ